MFLLRRLLHQYFSFEIAHHDKIFIVFLMVLAIVLFVFSTTAFRSLRSLAVLNMPRVNLLSDCFSELTFSFWQCDDFHLAFLFGRKWLFSESAICYFILSTRTDSLYFPRPVISLTVRGGPFCLGLCGAVGTRLASLNKILLLPFHARGIGCLFGLSVERGAMHRIKC